MTEHRSRWHAAGRLLALIGRALWIFLLVESVDAQQWEPSLASTASLRTGGATVVSSDSVTLDDGTLALITYWEARSSHDLDVYRCVDRVDSAFDSISQQCWRALRPTGRGPAVIDGVVSSKDLCGRPDDIDGLSKAAYCSFSKPMFLRTPYFELMIEPFADEGLVAVNGDGRVLVLTSPPWPSPLFLEVRATEKREREFFADVSSASEILQLQDQDQDMQCELMTVSSRTWAACQSRTSPESRTRYLVDENMLYEISYTNDLPEAVRQQVDSILASFRPRRPE